MSHYSLIIMVVSSLAIKTHALATTIRSIYSCDDWGVSSVCNDWSSSFVCPDIKNNPCIFLYAYYDGGWMSTGISTIGYTDITIQYDINTNRIDRGSRQCWMAYSSNNGGTYTDLKRYYPSDYDTIYLREIVNLGNDANNKDNILIQLGITNTGSNFDGCMWDTIIIQGTKMPSPTRRPISPTRKPIPNPTPYPVLPPSIIPTVSPIPTTVNPTQLPSISPITINNSSSNGILDLEFTILEIILIVGIFIIIIVLCLIIRYIFKLKRANKDEAAKPIIGEERQHVMYGDEGK
eukprot:68876_1